MAPHNFNVLSQSDGCDIHPVCTTCPLPACRYDMPPNQAKAVLLTARLQAHIASGLSVAAAARAERCGKRTAYRRLKAAEEGQP